MKYSGLTEAEESQFFEEGWVMVPDIFSDADQSGLNLRTSWKTKSFRPAERDYVLDRSM